MIIHPLKITSTLADETRYSIYEYILKVKKPVTVQHIAETFHIHPNVARLHLTKLTEIAVVKAEFEKTGKGGRPGRIYSAIDSGVSLSFPRQDFHHLVTWLFALLKKLGPTAVEACKEIAYANGKENIEKMLNLSLRITTFEQRVEILSDSASLIGYAVNIEETATGRKLYFSYYNCPYRSLLDEDGALVCTLHEAYLQGQLEALFDVTEFTQITSMNKNCDNCLYEINIHD